MLQYMCEIANLRIFRNQRLQVLIKIVHDLCVTSQRIMCIVGVSMHMLTMRNIFVCKVVPDLTCIGSLLGVEIM